MSDHAFSPSPDGDLMPASGNRAVTAAADNLPATARRSVAAGLADGTGDVMRAAHGA